jgi:hypothetical protein
MMRAVRVLATTFCAALLLAVASPAPAARRSSEGRGRLVSIQPFEGAGGEQLRRLLVRQTRARGFRVSTSIPRVDGTVQYVLLAREHDLAAFVTGDLEPRDPTPATRRRSITFLVWNGSTGSVLARWTVTAPPKQLPRAVARGFWRRLGPALVTAHAPPLPLDRSPAPTMFIDAGKI